MLQFYALVYAYYFKNITKPKSIQKAANYITFAKYKKSSKKYWNLLEHQNNKLDN